MTWEYYSHVENKLQPSDLFGWKRMLPDVARYKENVNKKTAVKQRGKIS